MVGRKALLVQLLLFRVGGVVEAASPFGRLLQVPGKRLAIDALVLSPLPLVPSTHFAMSNWSRSPRGGGGSETAQALNEWREQCFMEKQTRDMAAANDLDSASESTLPAGAGAAAGISKDANTSCMLSCDKGA